jgi:hypothetical protein
VSGSGFSFGGGATLATTTTIVAVASEPKIETEQQVRKVAALNTKFQKWVQRKQQSAGDQLWVQGLQDYLNHVEKIKGMSTPQGQVVQPLPSAGTGAPAQSTFSFGGSAKAEAPTQSAAAPAKEEGAPAEEKNTVQKAQVSADETCEFDVAAKLFELVKETDEKTGSTDSQWKERGKGTIQLLKRKDGSSARMLHRMKVAPLFSVAALPPQNGIKQIFISTPPSMKSSHPFLPLPQK